MVKKLWHNKLSNRGETTYFSELCFGGELHFPTDQIWDFEAKLRLGYLEGSAVKIYRAGQKSGKQVSETLSTFF